MPETDIQVERIDDNQVRVRTDRPGERAVSAIINGYQLIQTIADALGIVVTYEASETAEEPEQPVEEPEQPVEEEPAPSEEQPSEEQPSEEVPNEDV